MAFYESGGLGARASGPLVFRFKLPSSPATKIVGVGEVGGVGKVVARSQHYHLHFAQRCL